jgi:hypothetical protein
MMLIGLPVALGSLNPFIIAGFVAMIFAMNIASQCATCGCPWG